MTTAMLLLFNARFKYTSAHLQKTRQMAGYFVNGWGGRIRTCAWRYQKPLPYRLATPQQEIWISLQTKRGNKDIFSNCSIEDA